MQTTERDAPLKLLQNIVEAELSEECLVISELSKQDLPGFRAGRKDSKSTRRRTMDHNQRRQNVHTAPASWNVVIAPSAFMSHPRQPARLPSAGLCRHRAGSKWVASTALQVPRGFQVGADWRPAGPCMHRVGSTRVAGKALQVPTWIPRGCRLARLAGTM